MVKPFRYVTEEHPDTGKAVPPPSPEVLAEMERQGISVKLREWMIWAAIGTEYLSDIIVPLDIAVAAFDKMIFEPLPDIG